MANFNKADKNWLMCFTNSINISQMDEALVLTTFDQETNQDIVQIENKMKKEKEAKRVALYKVIMYPVESVITRVIFGKKALNDKRSVYKIYKAYYKNKINYNEFEKKLANVLKDC